MHQYFPHLSIRVKDLLEAYGANSDKEIKDETDSLLIDDAFLRTFVQDIEDDLAKNIPSTESSSSINIINIEKINAL